MIEYRTVFKKYIKTNAPDDNGCVMYLIKELPFQPIPNYVYKFDPTTIIPQKILWDDERQIFIITADPQVFTFKQDEITLNHLIEVFKKFNWLTEEEFNRKISAKRNWL